MSEKQSGFEVQTSQRQSWLSIAAVWAGGMICVPCLMIGGVLSGGGLSLAEIVISILIGYGLICVYMIFIGMQACDTGLPVAVMASGALGEKGARYVISTLIAIACIGWFGIQSATCGQAFATMTAPLLGMEATTGFVAVCSIIWGAIMLATACAGFKGLKWLNYIAVPLLVIVCLYGLIALVLATWTTNVTNAYSGGLALSNLLGFDESKFKITTGISGAIGTLLAAFGLLNAFQGFLSLMSALIPPLAGVIIAAYWIVGKGKKENFHFSKGVSAAGLISFIVGALVACITGGTFASFPGLVEAMPFLNTPFFVGPVNGIVVSLVLYVILAAAFPKKAN